MTPAWPDSDFADLPPAPDSSDPMNVARFVDQRVVVGNKVLLKHLDRRFEEVQRQIKDMHKCMLSAYPDGDPAAHRAAHEAQLRSKETLGQLRMRVWAALLGWAAIGSASAIGWALIKLLIAKGGTLP